MLAKQLKNSDFYSIFHNSTVTAKLFEISEMLPGIHLEYEVKCFPQFLYGQSKSINILGNAQWNIVKHLKNSDFYSSSIIPL